MITYTVHMVNFGFNKGTFDTLDGAVEQARRIGFECAIWENLPDGGSTYLKTIRP